MKTIRTLFLLLLLLCSGKQNLFAQCRPGYSQVNLNWNYLDFLAITTQHFAFGTNRLTISASPDLSLYGENDEHTAQPGDDVQFFAVGDNSITPTFEQEVYNLQFSLFDIDLGMRVTVTTGNNATVLLSKASPSSGIATQPGHRLCKHTRNDW